MTWSAIRIPTDLSARIDALRLRLGAAYENGQNVAIEPNGENRWDGHIPAWKIVERALDEYEGHLERSNKR